MNVKLLQNVANVHCVQLESILHPSVMDFQTMVVPTVKLENILPIQVCKHLVHHVPLDSISQGQHLQLVWHVQQDFHHIQVLHHALHAQLVHIQIHQDLLCVSNALQEHSIQRQVQKHVHHAL